jgi:ribosomal protein L20A (L18A)
LAAYPTFWISEKGKALKVKDFGIRLYYDSPSGTYNSKEFRELSPVDATKALYRAASGQSTYVRLS